MYSDSIAAVEFTSSNNNNNKNIALLYFVYSLANDEQTNEHLVWFGLWFPILHFTFLFLLNSKSKAERQQTRIHDLLVIHCVALQKKLRRTQLSSIIILSSSQCVQFTLNFATAPAPAVLLQCSCSIFNSQQKYFCCVKFPNQTSSVVFSLKKIICDNRATPLWLNQTRPTKQKIP